jgi:hypothetical protein
MPPPGVGCMNFGAMLFRPLGKFFFDFLLQLELELRPLKLVHSRALPNRTDDLRAACVLYRARSGRTVIPVTCR